MRPDTREMIEIMVCGILMFMLFSWDDVKRKA